MDTSTHWPASGHYPIVPNHIAIDPTPKDQAIYVPSITPGYAQDVHAQKNFGRKMPAGLKVADLNFLDPNNRLFRISHVMSSAGQALGQSVPCIITQRDRENTILICDSGGYQIASGKLRISGDPDRLRILHWMEQHADIAMTLDVPTGPLLKLGYTFASFDECLTATLDHLDFFQRNRVPGKIKLLNVLQGNDLQQSDAWYDAVKHFQFEGWAFAGKLRHSMYHFCRRILLMAHEDLLQHKAWIHVLGTCELDTAVLLTAMQRAINKHINPTLRISFDTSSPFRCLAFNQTYTLPSFDKENLITMPLRQAPNDLRFSKSPVRWPWPSPLGDRMVMSDFCVPMLPTSENYRDIQTYHYLAHHNLAALCWGIALANRVFDAENISHVPTIARSVAAAVEAIEKVIASGSFETLQAHQKTFSRLRHGLVYDIINDPADDERTFENPYPSALHA
jgi:hypothetical protein